MGPAPRRILFFGEAVSLSHVARPFLLAQALDPARYEAVLACHPRYARLFPEPGFRTRPIHSIPTDGFLHKLATGSPIYSAATLRAYVQEDLRVIDEVRPDLIVGDFRLSLSVSARLSEVPFMSITDPCWSPYGRQQYPLAEHPMTRVIGVKGAQAVFAVVRPFAFAYHCRPLNRVRKEMGLPSLGYDLRNVYTDADEVLYADIPELAPAYDLPPTHHYLGPMPWSAAVKKPDWWDRLPSGKPVVYVTFGTSGDRGLLPVVLEGLADLPVTVIAATVGRTGLGRVPSNAFIADYLPGDDAVARSAIVICNGGTLSVQQALLARVPVLGIATNMNQHLNMRAVIQRTGAGELLRAGTVTPAIVASVVSRMLREPEYAQAAAELGRAYRRYDAPSRFRALVERQEDAVSARVPAVRRSAAPIFEPVVAETATESAALEQFDELFGEILFQGFAESTLRMGVSEGRVLELGSANGGIATRLARLNPRLSVDAVEFSPHLLWRAQRKAQTQGLADRLRFVLAGPVTLPFANQTFDLVISNNAISRVGNPLRLLKEIRRVARPEGAILVRNVRRLPSFLMELLLPVYTARYNDTLKRLAYRTYHAAPTHREFRRLVAQLGLPRARVAKYFITSLGLEQPAVTCRPVTVDQKDGSVLLRWARRRFVSRAPSAAQAAEAHSRVSG